MVEIITEQFPAGRGRKMERTPTLGNDLVVRKKGGRIDHTPTDARASPFIEERNGVKWRVHEGFHVPGVGHIEVPDVPVDRYMGE